MFFYFDLNFFSIVPLSLIAFGFSPFFILFSVLNHNVNPPSSILRRVTLSEFVRFLRLFLHFLAPNGDLLLDGIKRQRIFRFITIVLYLFTFSPAEVTYYTFPRRSLKFSSIDRFISVTRINRFCIRIVKNEKRIFFQPIKSVISNRIGCFFFVINTLIVMLVTFLFCIISD